jgi:hypothetical protein
MELDDDVIEYRAGMTSPNQAIFDRITEIAQSENPAIQNAIKWRKPTFTISSNWHHWLFSIAQTKKGITLTFHKGRLLADPEQVLQSSANFMRHILFTDVLQIREQVVARLIEEAIRHQIDMD